MTRPLRFTPARTAHPTSVSKALRRPSPSALKTFGPANTPHPTSTTKTLSTQDLPPRHDSSAEVYTCAHMPRSPTFRLPSPTPSTRVCVRSPIISPVLGLPHSRARLLLTYSSAEVYTCAHTAHPTSTTKTLSTQDLRPRHDSSAEVHTCAHTPRPASKVASIPVHFILRVAHVVGEGLGALC
ncbi:hypothetical protein C8Q76DRAFT_790717 [Earliella scabrosa]|nr:hypothetical protein C8Q76DRAFT_790717 [Earliella scabrosa]